MATSNALTPGSAAEPVATPENTPLPGGGSWRWDDVAKGWAENPPYGTAPATPAALVAISTTTPQQAE